jgi:hypothetical protein
MLTNLVKKIVDLVDFADFWTGFRDFSGFAGFFLTGYSYVNQKSCQTYFSPINPV